MPGLGTVLNVVLIILGSIIGLLFRQGMKESLKSTLMVVCGLIIIFIGLGRDDPKDVLSPRWGSTDA